PVRVRTHGARTGRRTAGVLLVRHRLPRSGVRARDGHTRGRGLLDRGGGRPAAGAARHQARGLRRRRGVAALRRCGAADGPGRGERALGAARSQGGSFLGRGGGQRFAGAVVGLTASETVTCAVAPRPSETSSGRANVPACDGVPVSSPLAERWRLALRNAALVVRHRSGPVPVSTRSCRSKGTPTRPRSFWCGGTASG